MGNGNIKIGDFGMSQVTNTKGKAQKAGIGGTLHYMSPEVLCGKAVSGKTDVWSLGCVIHEACTLEKTFSVNNNLRQAVFNKIITGQIDEIPKHYNPRLF